MIAECGSSRDVATYFVPTSTRKQKIVNDFVRKKKSVLEDLSYIDWNRQCKTPKHVMLAKTVHHLTRSNAIVKTLNQLGYSISYDTLKQLVVTLTTSLSAQSQGIHALI